jgi:hypothetical protein
MAVMLNMADNSDGFPFPPRSPHRSLSLNPYDFKVLKTIFTNTALGTTYAINIV